MPVSVEISYQKSVLSPKSINDTFSYLSDWKRSIPDNFPGIKSFSENAPQTFHWVFDDIGYQNVKMAIELFARAETKSPTSLKLSPVKGAHEIHASWDLNEKSGQTEIAISFRLKLEVPAPFFLKGVVTKVAEKEITGFFDRYARNLEKKLVS